MSIVTNVIIDIHRRLGHPYPKCVCKMTLSTRETLTIELFNKVVCELVNKNIYIDKQIFFLPPGWTITFADSKKWAGICVENMKTIVLSQRFVNSPLIYGDDILDTILHELAHAIAGSENGHNNTWKLICYAIGCSADVKCKFFCSPMDFKYTISCGGGCVYYRDRLNKSYWSQKTCCHHNSNFNITYI